MRTYWTKRKVFYLYEIALGMENIASLLLIRLHYKTNEKKNEILIPIFTENSRKNNDRQVILYLLKYIGLKHLGTQSVTSREITKESLNLVEEHHIFNVVTYAPVYLSHFFIIFLEQRHIILRGGFYKLYYIKIPGSGAGWRKSYFSILV